jgi:5-methyltetrahydropteroyltriglutamate--homocysteine methyltransferase
VTARSHDGILTTHVGSLPRPHDLLDLMKARLEGEGVDEGLYDERVRSAVADVVRDQVHAGIDVVTDGEQSKPGFFLYVAERLEGFEPRPDVRKPFCETEIAAFPEYYEEYFGRFRFAGATVAPIVPMVCVGPVRYRGHDALRRDLENLRAAVDATPAHDVFVPAVAPTGVGSNEHYPTDEEYLHAVGEALREEYVAIVEAGFILQVDDPFLSELQVDPGLDERGRQQRSALSVEVLNHALRGLPEERIRFHTCYGINEGPRVHDADLADVAPHMLRVNARFYSFEAANPRHEHEYHVWETLRLPDGKALIPGVITHASNIVEHPEFIAERIVRFASLVGRENVIAGADCGFSSQASYRTEVHPTVIWAKFRALAEGARLASARLWR